MTKTRLAAVGVAFLVALAIAAAVTVYWTRYRAGVGDGAGPLATVVVATEDIPIGARLRPLIRRGVFKEVKIPRYALIENPVMNLDDLHGVEFTTAVIVKNEQIPWSRLGSRV